MSSRPYALLAGFPHQKRTTQTTNDRDLTWSVLEGDDAILSNDGCMMAAWCDRNRWATHDGATGVNPSRIIWDFTSAHVCPTMTHQPHRTNFWLNYLLKCMRLHLDNSPRNINSVWLSLILKRPCQEIRQRLPSAICQHHTRVALSSIPAFFLDGSSTALLPTYPEPMFYQHTKQVSSIIHELLQFTDLYIDQSRPPWI